MHTLDCETPIFYRDKYFFVWGGINDTYYEIVDSVAGLVTANATTGKLSMCTFTHSAYDDSKVYSIEDNKNTNSLQLFLRYFDLTQNTMTNLARVDDALSRQRIVTFKHWLYIAVVIEESTNARIKLYGSEFLQSVGQYFPPMDISFIYDNSFIVGPQGSIRLDALLGFSEEMTDATTEASRFWLVRISFDSCIDRDNSTMICKRCPAGYYPNGTYDEQNLCIEDTRGNYTYSMATSGGGQSKYNVVEYRKCAIKDCQRCSGDYSKCDHCLSDQQEYFFMNATTTSTICLAIPITKGFNASDSNFLVCADPNCEDCRENYRMCTKCKQPSGNPHELVAGRCSPIVQAPFLVSITTDVFNHTLKIKFSGKLSLEYAHTCSEYPDKDANKISLDENGNPQISCCRGEVSNLVPYSVHSALADRDLNVNYSCKMYTCSFKDDTLEVVFNDTFETFNGVFNLSLPNCTVLRVGESTWADFAFSGPVQFYKQWKDVSASTKANVVALVRYKWLAFGLLVPFVPHVASKLFKVYSHIKLMSLLGLSRVIYTSLVFGEINNSSNHEVDWRQRSELTGHREKAKHIRLLADPEYLQCGFPQLPFTNFVGCGPFEILSPDIDFVVLVAVVAVGVEVACFFLAFVYSDYGSRCLKRVKHPCRPKKPTNANAPSQSPNKCTERLFKIMNYLRPLFGFNLLLTVLDGLSPLLVYASLSGLFSSMTTLESSTSNSSLTISYFLLIYYFALPWVISTYKEYTQKDQLDTEVKGLIGKLTKAVALDEQQGGKAPQQEQTRLVPRKVGPAQQAVNYMKVGSPYTVRYLRKLSESQWAEWFKTAQLARDLAFPLLLYFDAEPLNFVYMQAVYGGLVLIMLVMAHQLDYATLE